MINTALPGLLLAAACCGLVPATTFAAITVVPGAISPRASPAPVLNVVVSRKNHGTAGNFDMVIDHRPPISGAITIEPRRQGAAHVLVFQFDSTITSPGTLAVVDDTGATLSGATATSAGNNVTVTLPVLADNRRITVSLGNVNGGGMQASASLGLLFGDVTRTGAIGAGTVSAVKAHSGQAVDAANYRSDVDTSGLVSAADIVTVRSRLGRVLSPPPGPAWPAFGRNAQHTGLSSVASQPLSRLRWSTPVDLMPQYTGTFLFVHYGPPVITARNTVVLPVKTGASGGFRFEARSGSTGALLWSAPSDYLLPAHHWLPSYNVTLTAGNRVYAPGAGGKIYYRDDADAPLGTVQTLVFYGAGAYAAAPAAFDATVFINTPITADAQGNIFFGYSVAGPNPANLNSGVVRVSADGIATRIDAAALLGTPLAQPMMNSAPALSIDQGKVYFALRGSAFAGGPQTGYLVALDSTTLTGLSSVMLLDPTTTGTAAVVTDNATSSPTVGPDGDVYFGMLGVSSSGHSSRGWMLHYSATLATVKTPGGFGWDNTPSMVPASMVPGYAGPSTYLLMSKYNSYTDGQHRIAILDPNQTQIDTVSGASIMKEILTILAVTPLPGFPSRFAEWCINTAAVDPFTGSVLVNSEDGHLYRWDLATNQLSERIALNPGLGQAYTATVIGPDGVVYAVNNAVLSAVGR